MSSPTCRSASHAPDNQALANALRLTIGPWFGQMSRHGAGNLIHGLGQTRRKADGRHHARVTVLGGHQRIVGRFDRPVS